MAELGQLIHIVFSGILRPTTPRVSGSLILLANKAYPRSRSRFPVMAVGATYTEFAGDEFCGKRVANDFAGEIYFGTVIKRIKGIVLAVPDTKGIRLWQAI